MHNIFRMFCGKKLLQLYCNYPKIFYENDIFLLQETWDMSIYVLDAHLSSKILQHFRNFLSQLGLIQFFECCVGNKFQALRSRFEGVSANVGVKQFTENRSLRLSLDRTHIYHRPQPWMVALFKTYLFHHNLIFHNSMAPCVDYYNFNKPTDDDIVALVRSFSSNYTQSIKTLAVL